MRSMRAIEAGSKKAKKWAELVRQQQQSGLSVTAFCRQHGFSDQTFYNWRKRLAGSEPVRFALVAADVPAAAEQLPVELFLVSGDRLRIAPGTDAATLRTVLNVLRERACCRPACGSTFAPRPAICARASTDFTPWSRSQWNGTPSPDIFSSSATAGATGSRYFTGIATVSRVWAKRLEEGTYAMPFGDTAEKRREITATELSAILSGIDLSAAKRGSDTGETSQQPHKHWLFLHETMAPDNISGK